MSEHDDILKEALAENIPFDVEKAKTLRKESSATFRDKMKWAERIMWLYLLGCVLVAVPTLNHFMGSTDTKTLISCVLVLLVVYETTVLLKLWFMIAGTKLSVLKEIKQMRLEVSQLTSATGVAPASDVLPIKYEPIRGTSKLERRAWIVGLAVAAGLAGSVVSGGYGWLFAGGGKLDANSLVILATDGSATSVTKITQTHSSMTPMTDFPFHCPKSWTVRWVDSRGCEMPYSTSLHGTHTRYDVSLPPNVEGGKRIAHTRLAEIPEAATQMDGVWTYATDTMYSVGQNDFTTTVLLPESAVLVATEPKPILEFTSNNQLGLRFQGTRGRNAKFEFKVQYRLVGKSSE